jgi:hypothetical protein
MTSISAFNDMMEQFITDLARTFPEEKGIKKYHASFDIVRKTNPRKCVEKFMEAIGPYVSQITSKDDSFLNENVGFLTDINLKTHWTPELSPNTKDAIWQYLQTLYMLGTTITSIPADTLSMIERVALQCAEQMQGDGSGGKLDESAIMSSMSSILGGLGGMGGLGGLLGEKK